MKIENISWSIPKKECCLTLQGLNPRPPDPQSDAHLNGPPRLACMCICMCVCVCFQDDRIVVVFLTYL